MNDSAHLMILKRKLKKRNSTPLNRLCVLSYMYSLFTSEIKIYVKLTKINATCRRILSMQGVDLPKGGYYVKTEKSRLSWKLSRIHS